MIDFKTKLDGMPRQRLRNETDVKRPAIMILGYEREGLLQNEGTAKRV